MEITTSVPPRPDLAGYEIGKVTDSAYQSPASNAVDLVTNDGVVGAPEGYTSIDDALTGVRAVTASVPTRTAAILHADGRFYGTGVSVAARSAYGAAVVAVNALPAGRSLPAFARTESGLGRPGADVQALIDGSTVVR